jgi:hypothetical protein
MQKRKSKIKTKEIHTDKKIRPKVREKNKKRVP